MARSTAPKVSSSEGISGRAARGFAAALAVALDEADMGVDGLLPEKKRG